MIEDIVRSLVGAGLFWLGLYGGAEIKRNSLVVETEVNADRIRGIADKARTTMFKKEEKNKCSV